MEPANYFTTAASLMEFLNSTETGLSHRTAGARLLRLGCKALRDLSRDMEPDGDIAWALNHLAVVDKTGRQLDDFEDSGRAIFDVFIAAESSLFEKIGMPPDIRRFVMNRATDLKHEYWNLENIPPATWTRMQQEVQALAAEICSYAESFVELEKWRHAGNRSAFVLIGGGIITLNASPAALDLGLTTWMTAKSGKLGSWIMKMGTRESEMK